MMEPTEKSRTKPRVNSASEAELDKVEKQFAEFDANVKSLTNDRLNESPKLDVEQQTKLAGKDIDKMNEVHLKPHRVISSKEKFNESYREPYNFQKEYVQFIAENKEIIGESIDIWTKPFAGMPAEEWLVPTNTPVWGPRYLAEQIKSRTYHRLIMKQAPVENNAMGQVYGSMAADTTINRLDAYPVSKRRSVFMGANTF